MLLITVAVFYLFVELLADERLTRTELFHPHGLVLSRAVNPSKLKQQVRMHNTYSMHMCTSLHFPLQVGFAYGCGQLCGHKAYIRNAIKVPEALFPYEEDPSRYIQLSLLQLYCNLLAECIEHCGANLLSLLQHYTIIGASLNNTNCLVLS